MAIGALIGAFALAFFDRRSTAGATATKLLFGVVAFVVVLTVQFALYRILQRFAIDPLADARIPFARTTYEAASSYWPFGSGVGTFVPVYATFEKVQDAIPGVYVNHAHNDFLEIWLETGGVGVVLMGLFALWLAYRFAKAWRRGFPGAQEIDRVLARAATVVIVLLLAHSLLDYPLRTAAMMTVFAFACALLVEPLDPPDREHEEIADARAANGRPTRESVAQRWPGVALTEPRRPSQLPARRSETMPTGRRNGASGKERGRGSLQ